jgi:LmbE family N-acetylglucosaminyl deacetylase
VSTVHTSSPILAVSPHLDDAVMAVGATIVALADAGREVVVCTVFAGQAAPPFSPVAEAFHADCGLGHDAVARRREEDETAVDAVGATAVHLQFLDAIYRRGKDGWLCSSARSMFDQELQDEPELQSAITMEIGHLIRELTPAAVWTCAAIGGHVDHRITRRAATDAVRRLGRAPVLWEPLPYAFGLGPPSSPRPLAYADVGGEHVERKIRAVGRYASQLEMLWPNREDWRRLFRDHAADRRQYGAPELLWNPDPRGDGPDHVGGSR